MFTYEKSLKISFLRTTEPEKLKLMWNLPDIMQILNCSNHGPLWFGGAMIGETVFHIIMFI
jgi:hypothetical protein